MKIILGLVLSSLSALNTFAADSSAGEKLTSYLPVGSYSGVTDQGVACSVLVNEVNYPKKDIQVRVIEGEKDLSKLVVEGSGFAYKDYKKEFIQTDHSTIGSDSVNYIEKIIRTVSAGDNKQYVVVSVSKVFNTDSETKVAECVIDL